MKKLVQSIVYLLFKLFGHSQDKQLVYFESFHGKQYSDNPKAVYVYMKQHFPSYRLIWGVTKGYEAAFEEEQVDFVRRFSLRWFLTMPRATAWVINTRTPIWLYKPEGITYIQTWHGTPLKKIGRDIEDVHIPGYTREGYYQEISDESSRWDVLVSPNTYSTDIFRRAFDYAGDILETGYPRNDQLLKYKSDDDFIQGIKQKLHVPLDKQVILYAPTWRETDAQKAGQYSFSHNLDFKRFAELFGNKIVLLVRMHYLVASEIDFKQYGDCIMDMSRGIDMSDLLLISDLLITDYSSAMFDFALTERPMIFYLADRQKYEQELRGFYFDIDQELPGVIIETNTELEQLINLFLTDKNQLLLPNYREFKHKFCFEMIERTTQLIGQIIETKL